jgi:tRNA1(Val) A37 N6-methylase TrmN6
MKNMWPKNSGSSAALATSGATLKLLVRATNSVLLDYVMALLRDRGLEPVVFDHNASLVDGSLGILPRRIMIDDDHAAEARYILEQAGLEKELAPGDDPGAVSEELTQDLFLGGRLKILQPKNGFRAAIDSVLMPAAVSSTNGWRVIDIGSGVGVGSLCLLAREPKFQVTALESDPALADLAQENARRNGLTLDVLCRDLFGERIEERFDQVITNPPYMEAGRGTVPPDPGRARANMEGATLDEWLDACFTLLEPKGTLTLIHRADRLPQVLSALEERAGDIVVFPFWPDVGKPARRVLVSARKGSRAPARLLAGMRLHGAGERYTTEAEAVLRYGAAIQLGS